jgi:hypothetical protein
MDDGWRKVEAGACGAWPLPADVTCARVARRVFRRTASALALDAEAIDDGETMVSELAANTLHAQCDRHDERDRRDAPRGDLGRGNGRARPARDIPGDSELWLYLRGCGGQRELVCKVFDAYPGWVRGGAPGRGGRRAPADSMSGRGLEVVHEMSRGRWGYHLTRARLGGWSLRGKAVWFATAAPQAQAGSTAASPLLIPQGGLGPVAGPPDPASVAMTRLEAELTARGFGETMVRADDPAKDTAVLSVCGELTLWCRAGLAWLRAPGLDGQAWGYGDLIEVAEQVVAAHEMLCVDPELASGQPAVAPALRPAPARGRLADPVRDRLVRPQDQVPEVADIDGSRHGRVRHGGGVELGDGHPGGEAPGRLDRYRGGRIAEYPRDRHGHHRAHVVHGGVGQVVVLGQ